MKISLVFCATVFGLSGVLIVIQMSFPTMAMQTIDNRITTSRNLLSSCRSNRSHRSVRVARLAKDRKLSRSYDYHPSDSFHSVDFSPLFLALIPIALFLGAAAAFALSVATSSSSAVATAQQQQQQQESSNNNNNANNNNAILAALLASFSNNQPTIIILNSTSILGRRSFPSQKHFRRTKRTKRFV